MGWPLNIIFHHRDPKRHYLGGKHVYEPSCVVISPAVWPGRGAKNTQTKNKGTNQNCDKLDVRPAHTLNPILTKFGMRGRLPELFLKFEFQDDRSINVGAVMGRNLPFPIHWQGSSLITARCALVQSAVLRSHVVCLSVCLSVTLADCDHIGWNTSEIISPLLSLGCSLLATPTWRVCSKGNTP